MASVGRHRMAQKLAQNIIYKDISSRRIAKTVRMCEGNFPTFAKRKNFKSKRAVGDEFSKSTESVKSASRHAQEEACTVAN